MFYIGFASAKRLLTIIMFYIGIASAKHINFLIKYTIAEWSSLVARRAHNPKVRGSNPLSATNYAQIAQSVEQRTENPRVGGSIPPLGTIKKLI